MLDVTKEEMESFQEKSKSGLIGLIIRQRDLIDDLTKANKALSKDNNDLRLDLVTLQSKCN